MKHFDFFKYDLNLLVAFDALYAERSVTKAARKVGVGQPAMSQSLARLRELFKDELFLRSSAGIHPTALATELAGPVREALQQFHAIVTRRPSFDPASAEVSFTLAMSDANELTFLPELAKRVHEASPGSRIGTIAFERQRMLSQLDASEVDLVVGVSGHTSPRHRHETLYFERHICLYNARLIRAKTPISLKDYLAHPHVLLSFSGDSIGVVDQLLAKRKAKRKVIVTTPHAHAIPFIVQAVPAIALVPERLGERCAKIAGLVSSRPPVDTGGFEVSMLWHTRNDNDPAHSWLREQLRAVCGGYAKTR